jgi:hypothetical protein
MLRRKSYEIFIMKKRSTEAIFSHLKVIIQLRILIESTVQSHWTTAPGTNILKSDMQDDSSRMLLLLHLNLGHQRRKAYHPGRARSSATVASGCAKKTTESRWWYTPRRMPRSG